MGLPNGIIRLLPVFVLMPIEKVEPLGNCTALHCTLVVISRLADTQAAGPGGRTAPTAPMMVLCVLCRRTSRPPASGNEPSLTSKSNRIGSTLHAMLPKPQVRQQSRALTRPARRRSNPATRSIGVSPPCLLGLDLRDWRLSRSLCTEGLQLINPAQTVAGRTRIVPHRQTAVIKRRPDGFPCGDVITDDVLWLVFMLLPHPHRWYNTHSHYQTDGEHHGEDVRHRAGPGELLISQINPARPDASP